MQQSKARAYGSYVCPKSCALNEALIVPIQKNQRSEHQSLTPREEEVMDLIAHEYSSKEIASELFISYHTVISHRKNIMDKMGVKGTAGMVRVWCEITCSKQ